MLTSEYFTKILSENNRVVVASPCGTGKTLGAADYIASNYRQGILYVAERQEQLTDMRDNLKERDVPYYDIAVYHNDTEERRKTAPITLITHSRLLSFPVTDFLTYHNGNQQMRRNLLVIDEALPSLLIVKVPELVATGFLSKMKTNWDDCGNLSEEKIRDRINSISRLISKHAAYTFQEANITYNQLDWTNNPYIDTNVSKQVRENGYRHILFQLLQGNYRKDDESIYVYIHLTPHSLFYHLFEHIVVLDATAHLTPFLYPGYWVDQPEQWNYNAITHMYELYIGIDHPSKTQISNNKETFLSNLPTVISTLKGFTDPHIVTFKSFLDTKPCASTVAETINQPVAHYGSTRGSNEYREKDSVILLGAFCYDNDFNSVAKEVYPEYDPYAVSLAHWIQEIYRSRIRDGQTIQVAVLGQRNIINLLERELKKGSFPVGIVGSVSTVTERIMRKKHAQTQQKLYQEILEKGGIYVPLFAKEHTARSEKKVWRAASALLEDEPVLRDWIILDKENKRIYGACSVL